MKIAQCVATLASLIVAAHGSKASSFKPAVVLPNGDCVRNSTALTTWWISEDDDSVEGCLDDEEGEDPWIMLRSYVVGTGELGVHWKWIEGNDTDDCMTDWTLFSCNHTVLERHVANAVGLRCNDAKTAETLAVACKPWCPLPVFVPEGVEGVTWSRCGRCEHCDGGSCTLRSCGKCEYS